MERYIEKLRSYLTEQKLPDESPQSILNIYPLLCLRMVVCKPLTYAIILHSNFSRNNIKEVLNRRNGRTALNLVGKIINWRLS